MTLRAIPRTIDEKHAALAEQVRRLEASVATTPVITDYAALSGKPTDLATIADVQAVQTALSAAIDDASVWTWVEVSP